MEKATKSTWKNFPIELPKQIQIELHFTDAQYQKLIQGFKPMDMDDRWFMYCEEDWIYFHRSWTGYGVFKAKFTKEEHGYSIKEFWAETNKEKYNSASDEADIELFTLLITKRSE